MCITVSIFIELVREGPSRKQAAQREEDRSMLSRKKTA
jgi:hypothetical protein